MTENKHSEYEKKPVPALILSYAIPSMIGMVMVLIYNLADTFFISQTKNALMVAAVSQATPAFTLFMSVGIVFGIGGTSLISRFMGMGKSTDAKHVSSFAFWVALVIGIAGMLFMLFGISLVTKLVGATAETTAYVRSYLQYVAPGVPFLVLSTSFSNILRAEGKPQKAMFGVILGNLTNIILDPVFIFTLHMDVRGAAIATVIGNVASTLFYLQHYLSGKTTLSIKLSDFKASKDISWGIFAIGIPASFNSFLMGISMIFVNNFLVQYGNMAVAGMGVASKMGMLLAILLVGFGLGVQPLFGFFYGAGNRRKFLAVLRTSLIFATTLSLILTVSVFARTHTLVGLFLKDKEALGYGIRFTRILIYSGPMLGALFVFNNAIQGMGKALPSLILSVSRQGLIYIPMLFVVNHFSHSPNLLIAAQPVTDFITVCLGIVLFMISFRIPKTDGK